jgi:hypothetical protein
MIEDRRMGADYPHIVLELGHVLFGRRLFRERPGQHELRLENRPVGLNETIKRGRHPAVNQVLDPFLDAADRMAGVALVPAPVEIFRGGANGPPPSGTSIVSNSFVARCSKAWSLGKHAPSNCSFCSQRIDTTIGH